MTNQIDGNEPTIDMNSIGPLPEVRRKRGRPKKVVVSEAEQARRTSPEHIEHLKKIGFQKGHAKVGGRQATPKETKDWIAGKSMDVGVFMLALMNDDTQPMKERYKAAAWLGEMSMSKAPTSQEIKVDHTYNLNNMLLDAQKMAGNPPPLIAEHPIIDVTPVIEVGHEKDVEAKASTTPKLRISIPGNEE